MIFKMEFSKIDSEKFEKSSSPIIEECTVKRYGEKAQKLIA